MGDKSPMMLKMKPTKPISPNYRTNENDARVGPDDN